MCLGKHPYLHIYAVYFYMNRNADRAITLKHQQYLFFCLEAVTFLVYRRLNTEQSLSVSLQYQLPLDSSLCFVC